LSKIKIHVLVVEDDEISAPLACTMLERLGCQVSVAINGAEAVERFSQNEYDLILMDWQMPVMDGVEATARIRELRRGHVTPIVGTSARAGRLECLAAGMNDLIPKPFVLENMRLALSKWTHWENDDQTGSASQR
jgi:CheY-like chemotaxis protein